MKLEEVAIGRSYVAKISGRLTVVCLREKYQHKGRHTHFRAVNLDTGREVSLTAAKLRREV